MFPLLRIRLLQTRRQAADAGLFYSLLALLVLLAITAAAWYQYRQPGHAAYVSAAIGVLILSLHLSRRDTAFIRRHLPRPVLSMAAEYAAVVVPLSAGCLLTAAWWQLPLLLAATLLIATLQAPRAQRISLPGLSRVIAPADFEWLAGFRKGRYLLLPLIVLAYAATPFRFVPLVPLWLLMAGVVSFYAECESLAVLRASSAGPKQILLQKLKRHSRLLFLLILPPLAINTIFQPGQLLINSCFLLLQWIVLAFSILLKYSTYSPNENLQGNSLLSGMAVFSSAMPILLPLPLLMGIRNYPRALRHLKNFTGDPN